MLLKLWTNNNKYMHNVLYYFRHTLKLNECPSVEFFSHVHRLQTEPQLPRNNQYFKDHGVLLIIKRWQQVLNLGDYQKTIMLPYIASHTTHLKKKFKSALPSPLETINIVLIGFLLFFFRK